MHSCMLDSMALRHNISGGGRCNDELKGRAVVFGNVTCLSTNDKTSSTLKFQALDTSRHVIFDSMFHPVSGCVIADCRPSS